MGRAVPGFRGKNAAEAGRCGCGLRLFRPGAGLSEACAVARTTLCGDPISALHIFLKKSLKTVCICGRNKA